MEKVLAHWRHTGFIPHRDVAQQVASWFRHFRQGEFYDQADTSKSSILYILQATTSVS
jgi:hypothetical protein